MIVAASSSSGNIVEGGILVIAAIALFAITTVIIVRHGLSGTAKGVAKIATKKTPTVGRKPKSKIMKKLIG